jgi:hypothetical protein
MRRPRSRRFLVLSLVTLASACSQDVGWDAGDSGTDVVSDIVDSTSDTRVDSGMDALDAAIDAPQDVQYDIQFADITRDIATDVMISPSHEYVYVMSGLTVDPDDNPANPHTGFDVDGLASLSTDANGCNHGDFGSALDPDQNAPSGCLFGTLGCFGAVDNQFPTMATTIDNTTDMNTRELLTDAVNSGRIVILVRISDLDSFADDDNVRVRVYTGFPTFTTGCTSVMPGREYQVDEASLSDPTNIDSALFDVSARIVAGRIQFAAPDSYVFTLRGSGLIPISIHAMRMRGDITPDALANGNLGGWDTGDDLVMQMQAVAPAMYHDVIPLLISGFVDVQQMGVCHTSGSMPRLGGVSLGAGFAAVPAVISTTMPHAAAPTAGVCGTF